MKLLKLEIHNISSIGDAVIDFTSSPLREADVFLITGATGAGKTTILDSLCLALYNQVPRMSGSSMNGSEEGINPTDPRQFLRHGAGEGFAAIDFIGEDGKNYRAVWEVHRAYNKPTGKLQDCIHSLRGEGFSSRNKSEIKTIIPTLTGLTYSQFCRTVMLPQGEFTRFLKSSDKEKSELLERIIGEDIYRRIGQKIFELTSAAKAKVEKLKEECEYVRPLSEEELEQYRHSAKQLKQEIESFSQKVSKYEQILSWHSTLTNLTEDLKHKQEDAVQAADALKSPLIIELRKHLDIWNNSETPRLLISEITAAKKNCETQREILDRFRTEYAGVLGHKISLSEKIQVLSDKREELIKKLAQNEPLEDIGHKTDTLLVAIDSDNSLITRLLKSIAQVTEEIARDEGLRVPIIQKLEGLKKLLPENADITALSKKKDDADRRFKTLKDALSLYESTLAIEKEIKDLRVKLLSQKENSIKLQKNIDKATAEIPNARVRLTDTEKRYNLSAQVHGKQALYLRTLLFSGCECPVCRQKVLSVPEPETDASSLLMTELKKDFDTAKTYLLKLETELSSSQAKLEVATAEYKSTAELLSSKQDFFEAETEKLSAALSSLSISADKIPGEIKIAEAEVLEDGRLLNIAADLLKVKTSDEEIALRLSASKASLKTLQDNLKHTKEARLQKVKELKDINTPSEWIPDKPSDTSRCRCLISDFLTQIKSDRNDFDKLNTSIDNCQNQLTNLSAILEKIEAEVPEWKHIAPLNYKTTTADVQNLATGITACVQLIKTYSELEKERTAELAALISRASYSLETLTELMAKGDDYFKDGTTKINTLVLTSERAQAMLAHAEDLLKKHSANAPAGESDPNKLKDEISSLKEQITAKNIELGAINQRLADDETKRKALSQKIEELKVAEKESIQWSRLDKISDREGSRFVRIAQSYVLESLIVGANRYLNQLTDRYTLHVTPGTYNINIIDRFNGGMERSANTGSGGESFMVSLSLALALSDLNGLAPSDTLFIDEGFGTLSSEPLEAAVSLLERLNKFSGRRVGVISHIEELQRRIPVQLSVKRDLRSGRSAILIGINSE